MFTERNVIGFDKQVLQKHQWQIVLKYLDCHQKNDASYAISEKPFTSQSDALQLVLA